MALYFATCARGLEAVLARELDSFGADQVSEALGGVNFSGAPIVLYKTHLWSRVANRVLYPLREAFVRDPEEVYELVHSFKWESFFRGEETLAVDCTIAGKANDSFRNSHFVRLRVKDAIVDRLRDKKGFRPDIDTENPAISVYLYVRGGKAVLGLDATGPSLHERGYRMRGFPAPLKETLAAGILSLSQWDPSTPFYDPFCGSGTLVIEAAMKAANLAPGLLRKHFLFMNWPEYYDKLWKDCVEEAKAQKKVIEPGLLWGSDVETQALRMAKDGLRRVGLSDESAGWFAADFTRLEQSPCEAKGVLICNPPYGERLGDEEELKPLYKAIGDTMKQKFQGWTGFVFTANAVLAKSIGLRSARREALFNGPLECRLLQFNLYEGSSKVKPPV